MFLNKGFTKIARCQILRKLSYVPIEDHLFGLTDEEIALRSTFRNFFEDQIPPQLSREFSIVWISRNSLIDLGLMKTTIFQTTARL